MAGRPSICGFFHQLKVSGTMLSVAIRFINELERDDMISHTRTQTRV